MEARVSIKLAPGAKIPIRASEGSCAYDLYSMNDGVIGSGERDVIDTGVSLSLPRGYYMKLEGRSGLAREYGLIVLGGVCDSDYTGYYKVMLLNTGGKPFIYKKHDRIAQMIMLKHEVLEMVGELPNTERGSGGFGSTGRA